MSKSIAWSAEELCSQYAGAVCRFAALLTRQPADADDLAQEVLVKAIRALPRFNSARGQMEGWLWRIAVNAAHDRRRSDWRRLLLWNRLLGSPAQEPESTEASAIQRLEAARVRRSLDLLSHRERTLLALRYGADLDYQSSGKVVGISEEAARKATERSLRRLRVVMEVKS